MGFTPYGALQAQSVRVGSYREDGDNGADAFALSYDDETASMIRSELGLWLDSSLGMGPQATRLYGRLAWAHDWNGDGDVQASFQSLPGASSFTVTGAQSPDDLALVTLGADLGLSDAARLTASFDGEFAEDYQSYAGTLALRVAW